MPPTRAPSNHTSTSTSSTRRAHAVPPVRRNLFHTSLSRRPTTGSSTSTSAETLRLDLHPELNRNGSSHDDRNNDDDDDDDTMIGGAVQGPSDIVLRNQNGEFDVGTVDMVDMEEGEDGDVFGVRGLTRDDFEEKERQRLAEAVKLHCRDRNRAPSEPVELLEAVRASLRAKVAAMAEDNWMYESGS